MRKLLWNSAQVIVTVLLTGSIAHAMSPSEAPQQHKTDNRVADVQTVSKKPVPFVRIPTVKMAKEMEVKLPAPQATVEPSKVVIATNLSCDAYIAQADITDVPSAQQLMHMENSDCNPQKYNTGGSNACGIAQELPCGKSGCGIPPNANGLCQVKWMDKYIKDRYGSWAAAIQFHLAHNWY